METRNPITDKQNLKNAMNEVEMHQVAQRQYDYDIDELSISQPEEDELERKSKLLEQRLKILQNTTVQTWNKLFPVFNIIAILSISGMQFGYGIVQITTIYNQIQLLSIYDLRGMPIGLGVGLLVALMPIGAIFGNCFGKCLIRRLRLKYIIPNCRHAHHFINILCMISSFALMQILTSGTILAGRFLYGFCIACYCAWSPRYIQDLAPVNLKLFVKSVYSIWVVGSIMLGYFFGTIFYQNDVSSYYRIMFCFPGILALIQIILMILFVPHSPRQLFQKQEYQEGRIVLEIIYKEEFIDMMMDRFRLEAEVEALKINANRDEFPNRRGRIRARFMGIYLNIFREFVGINTILIYSGYFIGKNNFKLGEYTNLILSLVAFVATVLSHIFFAERCGRKMLMLVSTIIFSICNFVIMAGMITRQPTLTFVFIMLFVLVFGITYSIVSSIYPAQILKNEKISYTSFTAWPAMVFATLIPPIVGDVIEPSHLPWPIFLFYGIYALLSALYIWRCAVESRNRQYSDILRQF